ncbi:MAG: hypothetical protein RL518_638 [Pseudomonadota bacterium]|jgi:hypothetical protein
MSLFLMIFVFAGSIVFVAARDIQARLAPATDSDKAHMQEILKDIQGERVVPAVKAAMPKEAMPDRSHGSYLARRDIERLKKFIVNLVHPEDGADSKPSDGAEVEKR